MVATRPKRNRDQLQAHYTSSCEIVEYMVSRLCVSDDDSVWEPCAGGGHLIDGVLAIAPTAKIRASEIDGAAFEGLQRKYGGVNNVEVNHEDALAVRNDTLFDATTKYTRIIANPPYGAYQTPDRRARLKKRFPSLYVRETYGLMLFHSLSLLTPNGRLVFIIPDTFLWLHRHDFLRRTILKETTIEEIALFPSKFFPGAKFGYSGMCVITIRNRLPSPAHTITVFDSIPGPEALSLIARCDVASANCHESHVSQHGIVGRPHAELTIRNKSLPNAERLERENVPLGEIAEVRTGFYSGNDRRWIRRANITVVRSRQYEDVDRARIFDGPPPLDGISGGNHFIPILRGGAAQFVRPIHWYVDWSKDAVSSYRRPGKNPARFQNAQFYFTEGIGVPMVASSRLTATQLDRRLFDQGIVGVFPKDPRLFRFLLGFLNTRVATSLLRQINPTANNSANYMKRLRIVVPDSRELVRCNTAIESAIEEALDDGKVSPATLEILDSLYMEIWAGTKPSAKAV